VPVLEPGSNFLENQSVTIRNGASIPAFTFEEFLSACNGYLWMSYEVSSTPDSITPVKEF
jgi:hypothetical protein